MRIVFAAILLACFAVSADSAPPSKDGPGAKNTLHTQAIPPACQQASDSSPSSQLLDGVIKAAPIQIQTTCGMEKAESSAMPEWVTAGGTVALALITLILAAITGALAFYTFRLWKTTADLANETSQVANKQIEEMAKSADAMAEIAKHLAVQTEASQYAIKLSQRAYLTVDNWSVSVFQVGRPVSGSYQVLNSGRLAANVVEQIVCGFIGVSIADEPDYSAGAHIAHSVVRPGAPVNSPFNFTDNLTQEEYDRIVARDFCVFVWGRVKYVDEFKEEYQTGYAAKLVWQRVDGNGRHEWVPWFTGTAGYHYTL